MKKSIVARAVLFGTALSACAISAVFAQAAPVGGKMYLSNGVGVQVFMINNQHPGSPLGTIQTGEAQGLAIDSLGRLLVAQGSRSAIAIYDTRTLRQVGMLRDPGQRPGSIAVGRNGAIYVGNVFSANNGAGSISVYEHGSTRPTRTLKCPSFYMINGVAVNGRGDVFVNQDRVNGSEAEVDMIPAGSKSCTALSLGEYSAGGAAIDPSNNYLLLADPGYREIRVVAPPYTSVTSTIYLPRCIGEEVADLALDPSTSLLYISDPANGADVLDYPGGNRMATYYTSGAAGIAISR